MRLRVGRDGKIKKVDDRGVAWLPSSFIASSQQEDSSELTPDVSDEALARALRKKREDAQGGKGSASSK